MNNQPSRVALGSPVGSNADLVDKAAYIAVNFLIFPFPLALLSIATDWAIYLFDTKAKGKTVP